MKVTQALIDEYNEAYKRFGVSGIRLERTKTELYTLLKKWSNTLHSLEPEQLEPFVYTLQKTDKFLDYYNGEFNGGRMLLKKMMPDKQMQGVPYCIPLFSAVVFGKDKTTEAYQLRTNPTLDSNIIKWILNGDVNTSDPEQEYELFDKIRAFIAMRGELCMNDIENHAFPINNADENNKAIIASLKRCIALMDAAFPLMRAMTKKNIEELEGVKNIHITKDMFSNISKTMADSDSFVERINKAILSSEIAMIQHFSHIKLYF